MKFNDILKDGLMYEPQDVRDKILKYTLRLMAGPVDILKSTEDRVEMFLSTFDCALVYNATGNWEAYQGSVGVCCEDIEQLMDAVIYDALHELQWIPAIEFSSLKEDRKIYITCELNRSANLIYDPFNYKWYLGDNEIEKGDMSWLASDD